MAVGRRSMKLLAARPPATKTQVGHLLTVTNGRFEVGCLA